MLKWLKLNGTDFNIEVCSSLSFAEFQEEGKHSFAENISEGTLHKMHATLISAGKPAMLREVSITDLKPMPNGNSIGPETKAIGTTRKGSGSGNRSNQKKS